MQGLWKFSEILIILLILIESSKMVYMNTLLLELLVEAFIVGQSFQIFTHMWLMKRYK